MKKQLFIAFFFVTRTNNNVETPGTKNAARAQTDDFSVYSSFIIPFNVIKFPMKNGKSGK